ncbi:hypothetical protein ASG90_01065 [Nocardioides sp. Soil797]|nr:hypothetical protein ASG90_01065 [Nocardioides sp. Soil797]
MEPKIDAVRGSGLRAAALLTSLGNSTTFHTCIDRASKETGAALFDAFGLRDVELADRPDPVTFRYDTPVSAARWGFAGEIDTIRVSAAWIVAFGMIDATWVVDGGLVVLDPQHGDLSALLASVTAQSIAVVLNAHEATRLTGMPPIEAGTSLLDESGVEVVVVKQGALGGLVFTASGTDTYGPIPTPSIRTIGSGDAFTAGFAHAWFQDPADPLAAAQMGARVAAAHSLTDVPQVSPATLEALPEPLSHPGEKQPTIYLAAPFFSTAERLLVEMVRDALLDAGLQVFSPLHDVGTGGDEVAAADLDGLTRSDAVLALLDAGDPGTVFETGWATRADIPVVGFTEHPDAHEWTMLRGTGTPLSSDLTSAIHLAAWAAIRRVNCTKPTAPAVPTPRKDAGDSAATTGAGSVASS